MLARDYPGVTFYVVPVDIVTQILNFGLSSPIDIQIVGPNLYANRALAERMLNEVRYVRGAADSRIQQPFNDPNFTVNVDRTRAESTGLTQQNVAQSMLIALSGSFQTSPKFLSRSAQRSHLQRRHSGAAVPARHNVRVREPAHHQYRNQRGHEPNPPPALRPVRPALRLSAASRLLRPPGPPPPHPALHSLCRS